MSSEDQEIHSLGLISGPPFKNEKPKVYNTHNHEGIYQLAQKDILRLDSVKPVTEPINSSLSEQNVFSSQLSIC